MIDTINCVHYFLAIPCINNGNFPRTLNKISWFPLVLDLAIIPPYHLTSATVFNVVHDTNIFGSNTVIPVLVCFFGNFRKCANLKAVAEGKARVRGTGLTAA